MGAKKLFVLFVLVVCAAVFAQENRVYIGARAGLGIGLTRQTDWTDSDDMKQSGGGATFTFGIPVSVQLTDKFALGTELGFTRFGAGVRYTEDIPGWAEKGDYMRITRMAMVLPILGQVTLNERNINILFGPHFTIPMGDVRTSTKVMGEKDSRTDDPDMFDDYNFPLGLTVGAQFGVGPIFLDLRYLTDLGSYRHKDADDGIRRSQIAFSVGYEFGLGSR